MVRDYRVDFDKGDLKDELERSGFDKCMVDDIVNRVDARKAHGWTYSTGREQAIREAQMLIDSSKAALERFRGETKATEKEPLRRRDEPMEPKQVTREVVTRETY